MITQIQSFLVTVFVLSLSVVFTNSAQGSEKKLPPIRAGLSLGAAPLSGFALSCDLGPVVYPNLTAGIELFGTESLSLRGLLWERAARMSGVHGGAKLFLSLGRSIAIEPGAEFGWSHRFRNQFDAGAGINLIIGRAIGGSLKLSFGYLFL